MRLGIRLVVMVALAIIAWQTEQTINADPRVRVGIGFGSGGVRFGISNGPMYGPGFYGPGYGRGYGYGYGPAPVVVRPYPVYVQPQPVYVQPQPVYSVPQYSNPSVIHDSFIPSSPTPFADGGEILLFSPATNLSDVRYTLNGHLYTMAPGTKQKFKNDRTWTVQFESSPGNVTTYTLVSARYKFKSTESGLGLFQTSDTPETTRDSSLPPAPMPTLPEAPTPSPDGDVVPPRLPALKPAP